MTTVPAQLSLRDRSKLKRHDLIRRTALQLFAERGYDATTVVDIAEAVEMAPRTISLYFPTKADLALAVSDDVAGQLTATFVAHPEVDFVTGIDLWLTGVAQDVDPELVSLSNQVLDAQPALRALSTRHVVDAAQRGGERLTEQLGLPVDDPMVSIVAGAIGGAIAEYSKTLTTTGLVDELHQAFVCYLRAIIQLAAPGHATPKRSGKRRPV